MKRNLGLLASLAVGLLMVGCSRVGHSQRLFTQSPTGQPLTLAQARRGFQTVIVHKESAHHPAPVPPSGVMHLVHYPSPAGQLAAYATRLPQDGRKHPAILWITGGDCNTIDDVWTPMETENDQTARAFREAGIVTMYPSLRGGNDNPGYREGFYGEVDDVLAAADYLAKQPGIDPKRLYLGGHSTGGTLVLLTAEMSSRFRAVFSFGPTDDVTGYGEEFIPADLHNDKEMALRSPGLWLDSIKSPVFVFEGTDGQSNIAAYRAMSRATENRSIQFFARNGADHFSILSPTNNILAQSILRDTGSGVFPFTPPSSD